ncbi:hypothetical protein DdX_10495 [Ditylenchus destructor]|uniref:Uncharacterized protein n=1 Tax=Ditylenchus destructor TaxID=166010 RepID=A0AAD4N0Z6_9BILA|nr:hypothetical protein DdX_10495 [Ditylenchus destructor]
MKRCNLGCVVYALSSLVLYNQAGKRTTTGCFNAAEEKWKNCSIAICTTAKIENSPTEYDIPNEVYLDATTGVKTIGVIMEANIPVGTFARPSDIFRLFLENEYSYKMKVLNGNGSDANVDENRLEATANMDKIVKKV